jgi:fatty acid-binding protein DegV
MALCLIMSLCILTNDSALFSFASFDSMQHLRCMPLSASAQAVVASDQADFARVYSQLEREFSSLLVLCPASSLLAGQEAAQAAAHCHGGMLKISVLNTGQIGAGLGMLAQLAARQAAAGASLSETGDFVRSVIPYLFTLFCPDRNPQDSSPASVDSTNHPIFSLEDGLLTPYKRVRTRRHFVEDLQEFLEEFERPQQLIFFHGSASKLHAHVLHEAAGRLFPGVLLHDLNLNLPLTALFGPQTAGLAVLEIPPKHVR